MPNLQFVQLFLFPYDMSVSYDATKNANQSKFTFPYRAKNVNIGDGYFAYAPKGVTQSWFAPNCKSVKKSDDE
ncbi:hypothetical protein DAMNIGENAA_31880 [Desulforhabdus amnigena]|uniref:Uncharacterized protein n=1 Tax=Desulforhabdus amnigena TaxID=40218 RepID=A0A9W6FVP1_9BACT|nr:hypothetical protein DAMNIGENAA_31880 [Desulforhabdus amnigena]